MFIKFKRLYVQKMGGKNAILIDCFTQYHGIYILNVKVLHKVLTIKNKQINDNDNYYYLID